MMKRLMDFLKKWLGNCDVHTPSASREGKQNKVKRRGMFLPDTNNAFVGFRV